MDASTSPVPSNHLLVIPSVIHADKQHPSFATPSSEDRSRITGSCQGFSGRMVHAMAAPGGRSLSAGKAAHVCFEQGLQHHNAVRPHNALGYPPPAPEARARLPLARPRRLAVKSRDRRTHFGVDQSLGAGRCDERMTIRPSVSYRGTANRWPRKPVPPEGRTRAARPKHHERREESGARGICALLRDHAFAVQSPNAPSRWRPPALH
jgi:hypothetical protein